KMGIAVVYKPHLEHRATLQGSHEHVWRANFKIKPDSDLIETVFGDWSAWASRPIGGEIGSPTTWVVLAAELEKSIALYSDRWLEALTLLKLSVVQAERPIRFGINLNWESIFALDAGQCASFSELLGKSDFLAFSLYGDFRRARKHSTRFEAALQAGVRGLYDRGQPAGCDWASGGSVQLPVPKLAIGEFGVGGNLRRSYSDVPAPWWRRGRWVKNRRALFKTFFGWREDKGDALEFTSLWTIGVFDPFGIHEFEQPSRILDPALTFSLRTRRWRPPS
ncbi:MAG: hypothetical protein AAB425_08545, partial [Bdellovibrionota bacterium]